MKPAWTETAKLPGGDMPDADFDRFLATVKTRFRFLDAALAYRLLARLWHPHRGASRHGRVHGRSWGGFRRAD